MHIEKFFEIGCTGTEKLKNLAVGDVFSTYDYVVSVTEVSGSESTGWTGRGVIEMSFLKLGATALSVPLAVRFENIHLNQYYQLLPGSKVITEFDPTWSNVMSVDVITDRLSAVYAEIKDILATNPEDKHALQNKVDELNTIKTYLATSSFRPDWITRQTTALDGVIDGTSCLINSANLRSTNSCSVDDVKGSLNNAESVMSNSSVIPLYGDVFDKNGNYVSSINNPNGHNLVLIRTLSLTYRPLNDYYQAKKM